MTSIHVPAPQIKKAFPPIPFFPSAQVNLSSYASKIISPKVQEVPSKLLQQFKEIAISTNSTIKSAKKVIAFASLIGLLTNVNHLPSAITTTAYNVGLTLANFSLCPMFEPQASCYFIATPITVGTSFLLGFTPQGYSLSQCVVLASSFAISLSTTSFLYEKYIDHLFTWHESLSEKTADLLLRTQQTAKKTKRKALAVNRLTFSSASRRANTRSLKINRAITGSSRKAQFEKKTSTSHASGSGNQKKRPALTSSLKEPFVNTPIPPVRFTSSLFTASTSPGTTSAIKPRYLFKATPVSPLRVDFAEDPSLSDSSSNFSSLSETISVNSEPFPSLSSSRPIKLQASTPLSKSQAVDKTKLSFLDLAKKQAQTYISGAFTWYLEKREEEKETLSLTPGSKMRAKLLKAKEKKPVDQALEAVDNLLHSSSPLKVAQLCEALEKIKSLANSDIQNQGINSLKDCIAFLDDFSKNPETLKKTAEVKKWFNHKVIEMSWPLTSFPAPNTFMKTALYALSFLATHQATSFTLNRLKMNLTTPFPVRKAILATQVFFYAVLPLRALLISRSGYSK
ncbi:hypothetical protein AB751O23_AJ_00120 [Chlamydiales bacterium SCGC AB-751-O23]|jgi:hypothetical protein|nr:hypothetical protein AB751O23_AJ_00120 [Chlamydiales bacterium SCGC AB-751-O23]